MKPILVFLLALTGCVTIASGQGHSEEEMLTAASALTKVATAAESTVRYGSPPEDIQEEDLLTLATAHDPSMLQALSPYRLRIMRKDRHAVVLVCAKDGPALLEDAGCTAKLDHHRWRDALGAACDFTVEPKDLCPVPGTQ